MPNEIIMRKWSPIMDAIKAKDKSREFLTEYAERHFCISSTEPIVPKKNIHPDIDPYGEEDWNNENGQGESRGTKKAPNFTPLNTLPISLKILSELNLEGKNCTIEDNLPDVVVTKVRGSHEDIQLLRHGIGLDLIQMYENVLIKETILSINKQLENHDNFRVNIMVSTISAVHENTFQPTLVLKSSYRVD